MNAYSNVNIFRGTENEIQYLKTNNKIVNYCFYFAWDTGNFYLGSQSGNLQKYGSGGFDKKDIENIARKLIGNELEIFIDNIKAVNKKIDNIEPKVNLDEILQTLEKELDNKLNNLNIHGNSIQAITGNEAYELINLDTKDIYVYITENSNDINNTFIQGNTYKISGINVTNITTNSYLANNYVMPEIKILNNLLPEPVMIGDTKYKTINIEFSVNNPYYLLNNLKLYCNNKLIQDNIDINSKIINNIKFDNTQTQEFKLVGTDIRNNTISVSKKVEPLIPIFSGGGSFNESELLINSLNQSFNLFKEYEINLSLYQYIWFIIPTKFINKNIKFVSSGFNVPMINVKNIIHKINNVEIEYNCYRSNYNLQAGSYIIEIKE